MPPKTSKDKIVFLDRDGVINEFPGNGKYVTKVKEFHFIPRSLDAITLLTENQYNIFVVSNQAGVGKGIYSQNKLERINKKMIDGVTKVGGRIKKVFYCTHRSDYGCDCRKPGIGSVRRALKSLNKDIRHARNAYFVGDTGSDIEAGHNAGCTTIFVLSGRERRRHIKKWNVEPDYIVKDLYQATQLIFKNENSGHSRDGWSRT
jgi:histidinol-phosphate phosphatase family protein